MRDQTVRHQNMYCVLCKHSYLFARSTVQRSILGVCSSQRHFEAQTSLSSLRNRHSLSISRQQVTMSFKRHTQNIISHNRTSKSVFPSEILPLFIHNCLSRPPYRQNIRRKYDTWQALTCAILRKWITPKAYLQIQGLRRLQLDQVLNSTTQSCRCTYIRPFTPNLLIKCRPTLLANAA